MLGGTQHEVEVSVEEQSILDQFQKHGGRDPSGSVAAVYKMAPAIWPDLPILPVGEMHPDVLTDRALRFCRVVSALENHPAQPLKMANLTALTWADLPDASQVFSITAAHAVVCQVVGQDQLQIRTYKFGSAEGPTSIDTDHRRNADAGDVRYRLSNIAFHLGGGSKNMATYDALQPPGVLEVTEQRHVYQDANVFTTEDILAKERADSELQFVERPRRGIGPVSIQDPLIEPIIRGLESLLAYVECEHTPHQTRDRYQAACGLYESRKNPGFPIVRVAMKTPVPPEYFGLATEIATGHTTRQYVPSQLLGSNVPVTGDVTAEEISDDIARDRRALLKSEYNPPNAPRNLVEYHGGAFGHPIAVADFSDVPTAQVFVLKEASAVSQHDYQFVPKHHLVRFGEIARDILDSSGERQNRLRELENGFGGYPARLNQLHHRYVE